MIHSFPFYVADWRDSEARLVLDSSEKLLYLELLFWCWKDGSLPLNEDVLAKISGMPLREFRAAWKNVQKQFYQQDGSWRHHKVEAERPRLENWREARREAGRKGGKARAESQAIAKAQLETVSKPPSSSSSSSSSYSTADTSSDPDLPAVARRIHAHHPARKGTLQEVERAIAEQLSGAVDILARAKQAERNHAGWVCSDDWQKENHRFVPLLPRWIREGRIWEEPPAPTAPAGGGYIDARTLRRGGGNE